MFSNKTIEIDSRLKSSYIGIFAKFVNIKKNSILYSTGLSCKANEGKSQGVNFNSDKVQCASSGGSQKGYGGIGIPLNIDKESE